MVAAATTVGQASCNAPQSDEKPTSPSVADVLRRFAPAYLAKHGSFLEAYQTRTLEQLIQCRTAALGGQSWYCATCGERHCRFHSCRNRHCPTCNGPSRSDWLERMLEDRLPVRYSHIVFTVPHELIPFFETQPRELYDLLFDAAWAAMVRSAKKRHRIQIAAMMALHTWGQLMLAHPHAHVILPLGGLSLDGSQWVDVHDPHDLVDGQGLADRFRALFLERLERLYLSGKLRLPYKLLDKETPAALAAWLAPLKCKGWIVNVQTPPPHCEGPEAALKYLAGYVKGAAIGNRRIAAIVRDQVTFTYKDYRRGGEEGTETISGEEFVRRFLLHVLPPHFRRVRHRGFLSNRIRTQEIARIRELLGAAAEVQEESRSVDVENEIGMEEKEPSLQAPRCPHCGADEMIWEAEIPPQVGWVARRYSRFAHEARGAGFLAKLFRPP